MKKCNDCGEMKPLSEFYSQEKTRKKTGEKYLYYPPYCKECSSTRSNKWQKDNHELYKKNKRDYHKTRRQNEVEYRDYDRERAKKQRERGYNKEYYERNKEYFSIYHKERRQRKEHVIADEEWFNCKKYFNNSCAYCELPIDEHFIIYAGKPKKTDFHKEHVDDEGSNDLSNCIPACQSCNSQKWTFSLGEWYNDNNINYTKERIDKIFKWLDVDHKQYIKVTLKA